MTQAPPVATTPRNYPIFTVRWLALHPRHPDGVFPWRPRRDAVHPPLI